MKITWAAGVLLCSWALAALAVVLPAFASLLLAAVAGFGMWIAAALFVGKQGSVWKEGALLVGFVAMAGFIQWSVAT